MKTTLCLLLGAATLGLAACNMSTTCNSSCAVGCGVSADCTTCIADTPVSGLGSSCQTNVDCCNGSCVNLVCTGAGLSVGGSGSTGLAGGNGSTGGNGGSNGGSSGGAGSVAVGQPCFGDSDCGSQYCSSNDGGGVCKCNDFHSPAYPCLVQSDCCSGASCTALFCVEAGGGSSGAAASSGSSTGTASAGASSGGSTGGAASSGTSGTAGGSGGSSSNGGSTGGASGSGGSSAGSSSGASGGASGGTSGSGASSSGGTTTGGSTGATAGSSGGSSGGACGVVSTSCTKDSECCSKYCPKATGVCTCNCADPSAPYACVTDADCCTAGGSTTCNAYPSSCTANLCQ